MPVISGEQLFFNLFEEAIPTRSDSPEFAGEPPIPEPVELSGEPPEEEQALLGHDKEFLLPPDWEPPVTREEKTRARSEALRLAVKIKSENRLATHEEKTVLAGYSPFCSFTEYRQATEGTEFADAEQEELLRIVYERNYISVSARVEMAFMRRMEKHDVPLLIEPTCAGAVSAGFFPLKKIKLAHPDSVFLKVAALINPRVSVCPVDFSYGTLLNHRAELKESSAVLVNDSSQLYTRSHPQIEPIWDGLVPNTTAWVMTKNYRSQEREFFKQKRGMEAMLEIEGCARMGSKMPDLELRFYSIRARSTPRLPREAADYGLMAQAVTFVDRLPGFRTLSREDFPVLDRFLHQTALRTLPVVPPEGMEAPVLSHWTQGGEVWFRGFSHHSVIPFESKPKRERAISLIRLAEQARKIMTERNPELRTEFCLRLDGLHQEHTRLFGAVSETSFPPSFRQCGDGILLNLLEKKSEDGTTGIAEFLRPRPMENEESLTGLNPRDALYRSLQNRGEINLPYLEKITGLTEETLRQELRESIIFDPEEKTFTLRSLYLAGDIKSKMERLEELRRKVDEIGEMQRIDDAVEALRLVLPTPVEIEEIPLSLNVSWVSDRIKKAFVSSTSALTVGPLSIARSEKSGKWRIETTTAHLDLLRVGSYSGEDILEEALNRGAFADANASLVMEGEADDGAPEEEDAAPVRDGLEGDTALANERVAELNRNFAGFIRASSEYAEEVAQAYNLSQNRFAPLVADRSVLKCDGLNPDRTPLERQLDDAALCVTTKAQILFQYPGAGKSLVFLLATLERINSGRNRKALILMPPHLIPNLLVEAQAWFPAKLALFHSLNAADFNPVNYENTFRQVATASQGIWLVGTQAFTKTPICYTQKMEELVQEIEEIRLSLFERSVASELESGANRLRKAEEKLRKAREQESRAQLPFVDAGFDMLVIDECNEYRNQGFNSDGLLDIPGSPTADHLKASVERMRAQNANFSLILADGTLGQGTHWGLIYPFLRMAAPETLAATGTLAYADWLRANSVIQASPKARTDGSIMQVRTIEPRVTNALRNQLGFVVRRLTQSWDEEGIPRFFGGRPHVITCPPTRTQMDFFQGNWRGAPNAEAGAGEAPERPGPVANSYFRNMAAATDPRYLNPALSLPPRGKVAEIIRLHVERMRTGPPRHGFSLVFCDRLRSRFPPFEMADQFRRDAVACGIPEERIVLLHELNPVQRRELVGRLNARPEDPTHDPGVDFLFLTRKRGARGLNIQTRIANIFNIDITGLYAEDIQAIGRGIRRGNLNSEVGVYYLCTQRSGEATVARRAHNRIFSNNDLWRQSAESAGDIMNSMEEHASRMEDELSGISDPRKNTMRLARRAVSQLKSEQITYYRLQTMARRNITEAEFRRDVAQRRVAAWEPAALALAGRIPTLKIGGVEYHHGTLLSEELARSLPDGTTVQDDLTRRFREIFAKTNTERNALAKTLRKLNLRQSADSAGKEETPAVEDSPKKAGREEIHPPDRLLELPEAYSPHLRRILYRAILTEAPDAATALKSAREADEENQPKYRLLPNEEHPFSLVLNKANNRNTPGGHLLAELAGLPIHLKRDNRSFFDSSLDLRFQEQTILNLDRLFSAKPATLLNEALHNLQILGKKLAEARKDIISETQTLEHCRVVLQSERNFEAEIAERTREIHRLEADLIARPPAEAEDPTVPEATPEEAREFAARMTVLYQEARARILRDSVTLGEQRSFSGPTEPVRRGRQAPPTRESPDSSLEPKACLRHYQEVLADYTRDVLNVSHEKHSYGALRSAAITTVTEGNPHLPVPLEDALFPEDFAHALKQAGFTVSTVNMTRFAAEMEARFPNWTPVRVNPGSDVFLSDRRRDFLRQQVLINHLLRNDQFDAEDFAQLLQLAKERPTLFRPYAGELIQHELGLNELPRMDFLHGERVRPLAKAWFYRTLLFDALRHSENVNFFRGTYAAQNYQAICNGNFAQESHRRRPRHEKGELPVSMEGNYNAIFDLLLHRRMQEFAGPPELRNQAQAIWHAAIYNKHLTNNHPARIAVRQQLFTQLVYSPISQIVAVGVAARENRRPKALLATLHKIKKVNLTPDDLLSFAVQAPKLEALDQLIAEKYAGALMARLNLSSELAVNFSCSHPKLAEMLLTYEACLRERNAGEPGAKRARIISHLPLFAARVADDSFHSWRYGNDKAREQLKMLAPGRLNAWRASTRHEFGDGSYALETDAPDYLMNVGEARGGIPASCQGVTTGSHNECLMAYVLDANKKLVEVFDRTGSPRARSIIKVAGTAEKPVLILQRAYGEPLFHGHIRAVVQWKAAKIGATPAEPGVHTEKGRRRMEVEVTYLSNNVAEYDDLNHGEAHAGAKVSVVSLAGLPVPSIIATNLEQPLHHLPEPEKLPVSEINGLPVPADARVVLGNPAVMMGMALNRDQPGMPPDGIAPAAASRARPPCRVEEAEADHGNRNR